MRPAPRALPSQPPAGPAGAVDTPHASPLLEASRRANRTSNCDIWLLYLALHRLALPRSLSLSHSSSPPATSLAPHLKHTPPTCPTPAGHTHHKSHGPYPKFLTSQSFRLTCEAGKMPLVCLSRKEKPRYQPTFSSRI